MRSRLTSKQERFQINDIEETHKQKLYQTASRIKTLIHKSHNIGLSCVNIFSIYVQVLQYETI